MPVTDLAASFLFSETLKDHTKNVQVVNLATDKKKEEEIRSSYKKVFPDIEDKQFDFRGTRTWAAEFIV